MFHTAVPRPAITATALVVILCATGCASFQRAERSAIPPEQPLPAPASVASLKAHLLNGDVAVFERWEETPSGVHGTGLRYDAARMLVHTGEIVLSRDSVALFETTKLVTSGAVVALGIITGASAALTVYCLNNTKACFGSCPTFYVSGDGGADESEGGGEALVLRAEGYSSSIAPALEAPDVDDLARTAAPGETFELRMTNEALETHVTRYAELLAVPQPSEGRVYFVGSGTEGADTGRFVVATREQAPRTCYGPEGDCLEGVTALLDGRERVSLTDEADIAARETLELLFDGFGEEAHLGLVIGARQSLVTTFLFYQMLAFMGNDAAAWMARLERLARAEAEAGGRFRPGLTARLGGIDVEVWDGAGWVPAGVLDEHGPLAIDVHLVPLPTASTDGPVRVRLRMAQGSWRLDAVRLAALGPDAIPVRLAPVAVDREHVDGPTTPDSDAYAALLDPSRHLVTLPGDALRLRYSLPETLPAGADTWALFLESRGYYLEWLREEWRSEADPVALAQILYAPEEALRTLAPRFKEIEPFMEAAFWGSRYAAPAPPPIP